MRRWGDEDMGRLGRTSMHVHRTGQNGTGRTLARVQVYSATAARR